MALGNLVGYRCGPCYPTAFFTVFLEAPRGPGALSEMGGHELPGLRKNHCAAGKHRRKRLFHTNLRHFASLRPLSLPAHVAGEGLGLDSAGDDDVAGALDSELDDAGPDFSDFDSAFDSSGLGVLPF